ncbi:hypothetical protein ACHAQH_004726 [Verticillium albo-atrum]
MSQPVGGLPARGPVTREPNIPDDPPETRHNSLITPSDPKFKAIEEEFRAYLADPRVAIGEVLDKYFTPHETKLFLPAAEPSSLVEIQDENTDRYRDLIRCRFQGHPLSLATKFTMLYFGLPIEPALSRLFDAQRPRFEVPDDDTLQEVTARPPLHFLTAHDQRNYGYDYRRGREAKFSTIPVPASSLKPVNTEPVSLGLRGGGDGYDDSLPRESDDEDDQSNDHESEKDQSDKDEDSDVGMKDDDVKPKKTKKKNPPAQRAKLPSQTWLYGFQGRIYIDVMRRKEAETALEALLSMRPEHECDVVLRRYDRRTHEKHEELFFQAHADVVNYIADHFSQGQDAWFVHRAGELAPETYIPANNTFDTLIELTHTNKEQARVAYFRAPPRTWFEGRFRNANNYWSLGANHYMPFLKNAQDVLLGRPPVGRRGPHALLHYADKDGNDIKTVEGLPVNTAWYGGNEINPNLFHWMTPKDTSRRHILQLQQRPLNSRSAVLLAPGSANARGTHVIEWPFNNLRHHFDSFCQEEFPNVNIEKFFVWYQDEFLTGQRSKPMGRWDPRESDTDKIADDALHMGRLMRAYVTETHGNGCAFVLQPQYDHDITDDTKCQVYLEEWEGTAPFPEQLESVDMLYEQLIFASKNIIEGRTGRRSGELTKEMLKNNHLSLVDGPPTNPSTRTYIVTESTTHDEMRAMRRQMTSETISVRLIHNNQCDFVERMNPRYSSSHPWGPRYGLVNHLRERLGFEVLPNPGDPVFEKLQEKLSPSKKAPGPETKGMAKEKGLAHEEILEKEETTKFPIDRRELSWARQPSIRDSGMYNPSIPINAPPKEAILRTGNSRVPMLSLGTLTPTEVARMQRDFHELRNLNIQRITFCPFPDCEFSYRVDDVDKISRHLEQHTAYKCPWCPEKLYEHWDKPQRDRHFKNKHEQELRSILKLAAKKSVTNPFVEQGLERENSKPTTRSHVLQPFSWTAKPNSIFEHVIKRPADPRAARLPPNKANPKEKEFSFCDRCGRDHNMLNDAKDRKHHDRVCVPHAEGAGSCTFCETCGSHVWNTEEDALAWEPTAELPHRCRGLAHSGKPFCKDCGLSLGQFSDDYIDNHRKYCGAFYAMIGTFCPYCQLRFDDVHKAKDIKDPVEAKKRHINACRNDHVHPSLQVQQGEMTPFDLYDEDYWQEWVRPYDELYDGPRAFNQTLRLPHRATRTLFHPLAWWEKQGPQDSVVDPPMECGVCKAALIGLDASSVLKHFETDHNEEKPLETCPLCDLSFTAPPADGEMEGYLASRAQQQRHIECHVFDLWNNIETEEAANRRVAHPTENPFRQGHPLWNPEENWLDRRDKRCPAFAVCGAMVGFMTPEQWRLHKKQVHGSEEWQLETPGQIASGERAVRAARLLGTKQKGPGGRRGGGGGGDDDESSDTDGSDEKKKAAKREAEAAAVKAAEKAAEKAAAEKAAAEKAAIPPANQAGSGAGGNGRGGKGQRDEEEGKQPARKAEKIAKKAAKATPTKTSKKAAKKSAEEPSLDDFEPDEADYCSRCLRKMPLKNKIYPGQPSWEDQVLAHCDPERSCRIPNQRGSHDGVLPNVTGFLTKKQVADVGGITTLRKTFAETHPTYAKTIYPTDGTFGRSITSWEFDPNRDDNSDAWDLPFPPGEDEEGDEDDEGDEGDEDDEDDQDDEGGDEGVVDEDQGGNGDEIGEGGEGEEGGEEGRQRAPATPASKTTASEGSSNKRKRGDPRADPSYRPTKEELAIELQETQQEMQDEDERLEKERLLAAKKAKHS